MYSSYIFDRPSKSIFQIWQQSNCKPRILSGRRPHTQVWSKVMACLRAALRKEVREGECSASPCVGEHAVFLISIRVSGVPTSKITSWACNHKELGCLLQYIILSEGTYCYFSTKKKYMCEHATACFGLERIFLPVYHSPNNYKKNPETWTPTKSQAQWWLTKSHRASHRGRSNSNMIEARYEVTSYEPRAKIETNRNELI